MWLAADPGDLAAALIPAVWTFLGIIVVTLGTIAVQALKGRSERSSSVAPADPGLIARLTEQLQDRELRDQRDVLDEHHARLLALERYHDRRDPDWRRG